MLTDALYFANGLDCYLPNLKPNINISDKQEFEKYLEQREIEYLELFFGYELAKLLLAAYAASIATPTPTPLPARFSALINGAEFTANGVLQKWRGLRREAKVSPIAYYTYYYWRRLKVTTTADQGELLHEIETSTQIGVNQKMVQNWNQGVLENCTLYNFMQVNQSDYPEYHLHYTSVTLLRRINEFM